MNISLRMIKGVYIGYTLFCIRKPHDSRVVQKSLSGESTQCQTICKPASLANSQRQKENIKLDKQDNITNSLAHSKWNCKYHIVFAPKYRRKIFYNEKRADIREILKTLCTWKGVEICPDHVHLLLSIPPKISVSGFMGYLKGKSSLMIFQKQGNMKFAYRNREFWCRGYYVDTVGKNTKMIKEYIENQIKTDKETDQLSLFDPRDPFKKGQQVIDATLTGLHKHTCMQQTERGLGPKK